MKPSLKLSEMISFYSIALLTLLCWLGSDGFVSKMTAATSRSSRYKLCMEARKPLIKLSNDQLIDLFDSISPMDGDFKARVVKSGLNGFLLESLGDTFIASSPNIGQVQFSAQELLLIVGYRTQIRKEDEESKQKKIKAENARYFFFCDTTLTISEHELPSDNEYKNFLKGRGLLALAKVNSRGNRVEISVLSQLENNMTYFGVPKRENTQLDWKKEVVEMIQAVRSKADFSTKRYLDSHYESDFKFSGHDVNITDSKGVVIGDVDSLFVSENIHVLVERKRTVGEEIFKQLNDTRTNYIAKLSSQDREKKKVVSVLYSESLNNDIAKKLLCLGVHVLQDSVECRFFTDENHKTLSKTHGQPK